MTDRALMELPPHDIAAEEAVIAALLLDDQALFDVLPILDPADFFREVNGWAYEAAIQLIDRGDAVTVPTLAHELDRAGRLDDLGGEVELQRIVGDHFTAVGVDTHARIIARDAGHRRLLQAAYQTARLAHAGGPDLDAVIAEARRLIDDAEGRRQASAMVSVEEAIRELGSDDQAHRVTTGYGAIDAITGGLAMGQLSVVGARTDQGKTGLMTGMAVRIARAGESVAYLPLEDSRDEAIGRMTDHLAGVSRSYAERHEMSAALEGWEDALDQLAELPISLPDKDRTPDTIDALCGAITATVRRHEARVVLVDHIDAMPLRRAPGLNDAAIVAEWMRRLKAIAIRLDVHVCIASQVNRQADEDGEIPPRMHRLKESGAKEQAAQTVLMIGLHQLAEDADPERRTDELAGYVEKVKGYPGGRWIGAHTGGLYVDRHAGSVYEHGVDDLGAPAPEQHAMELAR